MASVKKSGIVVVKWMVALLSSLAVSVLIQSVWAAPPPAKSDKEPKLNCETNYFPGAGELFLCVEPEERLAIVQEINSCGTDASKFTERLRIHVEGARAAFTDSVGDMHQTVRDAVGFVCQNAMKPGVDLLYKIQCYRDALSVAEHEAEVIQNFRYNDDAESEAARQKFDLDSSSSAMDVQRVLLDKKTGSFVGKVLKEKCGTKITDDCFDNNLSALHQELLDASNEMSASFDEMMRWSALAYACKRAPIDAALAACDAAGGGANAVHNCKMDYHAKHAYDPHPCAGAPGFTVSDFVPSDDDTAAIKFEPFYKMPGKTGTFIPPVRVAKPEPRTYTAGQAHKDPRLKSKSKSVRKKGEPAPTYGGGGGGQPGGSNIGVGGTGKGSGTGQGNGNGNGQGQPGGKPGTNPPSTNPPGTNQPGNCTKDPSKVTPTLPLCAGNPPGTPQVGNCTKDPAKVTPTLPLCTGANQGAGGGKCTKDPAKVTATLPLCSATGQSCTQDPTKVTATLPLCPKQSCAKDPKDVSPTMPRCCASDPKLVAPDLPACPGAGGGTGKGGNGSNGSSGSIFGAPGAKPSKTVGGTGGGGNAIKCDADSQKGYLDMARKPRFPSNYPDIIEGQQMLYFCRVNQWYSDDAQAIFLSRLGIRAAKVAQALNNPITACSVIDAEKKNAYDDVRKLRTLDTSPELKKVEDDLADVSSKSCIDLAGVANDATLQSQYQKDLGEWMCTADEARQGSTNGFSGFIARCPHPRY